MVQRIDSRYVIEITNYTRGQVALRVVNSMMKANQTISGNYYFIDFFGAGSLLDEAYGLYSNGQFEEARFYVGKALEAYTYARATCFVLLVVLLLVISALVYVRRRRRHIQPRANPTTDHIRHIFDDK